MGEDYKVEAKLVLEGAEKTSRDARRAAVDVARLGREIIKAQRATQALAAKRDRDQLARFGHQMGVVAREAHKQEMAARRAAAASRRAAAEAMRAQRESARMMASVSAGFSRVGGAMTGVSRTIGRIGMGLGLLGAGAAYVGLRIARTMVTDIGLRALQVNSQVEDMITSLASVSQYVEGVDFRTAQEGARGVYRELERLAAVSPGTAQDLATVYNMIYGPMRRAGTSMREMSLLSQHAVSVGAALGVDYQQIARDMSLMATGAAGQDVKTFRLLRSMGLLTETTQQWNQMAQNDPSQAASRMVSMFARLGGPAAEAYGRTWTGISSSFADLMNQFGRLLTAPAFEVLKERLAAVVAYLQRHQTWIRSTLTTMGERLGSVFRRIIDRGQRAYEYILTHWDEIHARFDRLVTRVRELIPMLLTAAKVAGGLMVGTRVAGAGLSAVGAAGGMLSGLTTLGLGGGAAAAGGGGAATAALTTIAAVAAPVAIVFGALAVGAAAVWRAFVHFGDRLWGIIEPLWGDIQALGADLGVFFAGVWAVVDPILSMFGVGIVTNITTPLHILLPILRIFTASLAALGGYLSWFGNNVVQPVFGFFSDMLMFFGERFRDLGGALSEFVAWIRSVVPGMGGADVNRVIAGGNMPGELAGVGPMTSGYSFTPNEPRRTAPDARPTTNIDMRGSRIEVRQEFREADPDRVLVAMRDALGREAVHRISSGFVPALTR